MVFRPMTLDFGIKKFVALSLICTANGKCFCGMLPRRSLSEVDGADTPSEKVSPDRQADYHPIVQQAMGSATRIVPLMLILP